MADTIPTAGDSGALTQGIHLTVTGPPPTSKPLAGLLAHLKEVDRYLNSIRANTSGQWNPAKEHKSLAALYAKDAKELEALLQTAARGTKLPGKGAVNVTAMLESLGLDNKSLQEVKARMATLRKSFVTQGWLGADTAGFSFTTTHADAAKGIKAQHALAKGAAAIDFALQKLFAERIQKFEASATNAAKLFTLTPTPSQVSQASRATASGAQVQAAVGGEIKLAIPAAQVLATVLGEIKLVIPGGQIVATGGAPTRKGANGANGATPAATPAQTAAGAAFAAEVAKFKTMRAELAKTTNFPHGLRSGVGYDVSAEAKALDQQLVANSARQNVAHQRLRARNQEYEVTWQTEFGKPWVGDPITVTARSKREAIKRVRDNEYEKGKPLGEGKVWFKAKEVDPAVRQTPAQAAKNSAELAALSKQQDALVEQRAQVGQRDQALNKAIQELEAQRAAVIRAKAAIPAAAPAAPVPAAPAVVPVAPVAPPKPEEEKPKKPKSLPKDHVSSVHLAPQELKDLVSLTTTERVGKPSEVVATTMLAEGKLSSKTFRGISDEIKAVTKDTPFAALGKKMAADLTNLRTVAAATELKGRTGDPVKDWAHAAAVKTNLRTAVQAHLTANEGALPVPARPAVVARYAALGQLLEGQAQESTRRAGALTQAALQRQMNENLQKRLAAQAAQNQWQADAYVAQQAQERAQIMERLAQSRGELGTRIQQAKLGRPNVAERLKRESVALDTHAGELEGFARHPGLTNEERIKNEQKAAALRTAAAVKREASKPPLVPKLDPNDPSHPNNRQYSRGWGAFLPANLLQNMGSFAGWTAASTVIIGAMGAAAYSMKKLIDVGQQTARLSQVFRGVGGSAQDLTRDVQRLAAANGRSTDEALESAIAWSRLGLNRVQVNEAVRVSLMAANVAEMTAGEATKNLAALMAAYGMSVGELDGVLGMLNNTSNKYNVTNAELFSGLARTSAVAKQAGLPLAELQALIGATVGRTGQSGANMGNAIKSVIVQLSNPVIQDFMQHRFGVETGGEEVGQVKSMSQVLRELFLTYRGLNDEERQSMTIRIGGRTQASRFVAIMESYMTSQRLAADAQLNLNSAEEENNKILGTQKAQLVGLRTEWDRIVVSVGNQKGIHGGPSINESLVASLSLTQKLMRGAGVVYQVRAAMSDTGFGSSTKWLNDALTSPDEKRQDRYLQQTQEIASLGRESQGYAQTAERYQTLAALVKNPKARPAEIATELRMEDEQLARLYEQGKQGEALIEIERRRTAAAAQGNTARAAGAVKQQAYVADLGREIKLEEARRDQAQQRKNAPGVTAANDRLRNLIEQKRVGEGLKSLLEDPDDLLSGDTLGHRQRTVNQLAANSLMQQQVDAAYKLGDPESAVGQLDRQAAAAREKVRQQDQLINLLKKSGKSQEEIAAFKQLQEYKATVANAEDPAVRAGAETLDRRSFFARRAKESVEYMGTGVTPSERLLNREIALRDELGEARRRASDPALSALQQENENTRALVFQNGLLETREAIVKRTRDLAFEETQARLESQREFQKSLLFAGPGDLLRKLAAQQMANRPGGISPGQWFAMDPARRQEVDQARGGEALRRIREERARLDSRELSPEEEAQQRASANEFQSAPQPLRGFAAGGYTGPGNPNEIAGVVHKGEYVIPNVSGGIPAAGRIPPTAGEAEKMIARWQAEAAQAAGELPEEITRLGKEPNVLVPRGGFMGQGYNLSRNPLYQQTAAMGRNARTGPWHIPPGIPAGAVVPPRLGASGLPPGTGRPPRLATSFQAAVSARQAALPPVPTWLTRWLTRASVSRESRRMLYHRFGIPGASAIPGGAAPGAASAVPGLSGESRRMLYHRFAIPGGSTPASFPTHQIPYMRGYGTPSPIPGNLSFPGLAGKAGVVAGGAAKVAGKVAGRAVGVGDFVDTASIMAGGVAGGGNAFDAMGQRGEQDILARLDKPGAHAGGDWLAGLGPRGLIQSFFAGSYVNRQPTNYKIADERKWRAAKFENQQRWAAEAAAKLAPPAAAPTVPPLPSAVPLVASEPSKRGWQPTGPATAAHYRELLAKQQRMAPGQGPARAAVEGEMKDVWSQLHAPAPAGGSRSAGASGGFSQRTLPALRDSSRPWGGGPAGGAKTPGAAALDTARVQAELNAVAAAAGAAASGLSGLATACAAALAQLGGGGGRPRLGLSAGHALGE